MTNGTKARIGMVGYVRLLALLKTEMPRAEFAAAGGIGEVAARRFLEACHKRGRVHICDWLMPYKAAPLPVWVAGRGTDATPPTHRQNGRAVRPVPPRATGPIRIELLTFLNLLDLISSGARTAAELQLELGVEIRLLRRVMSALRETEQARIARWQAPTTLTGKTTPAFALGAGPDAPRPVKTVAEINRAYRARHQKQPNLRRPLAANASVFHMHAA